jgi:hypothetical protein
MAHRHEIQKKAHGGGVGGKNKSDAGHEPRPSLSYGNKDVVREAFEKKSGGAVAKKGGGKVVGRASGGRLDKRARGGGVGADQHPFSSAHKKHGGAVKK